MKKTSILFTCLISFILILPFHINFASAEDEDQCMVGLIAEPGEAVISVLVIDSDCDGLADQQDNCPEVPNAACNGKAQNGAEQSCDANEDGVTDDTDIAGSEQMDSDDNGIGDACDDRDQDYVKDVYDNCPDVKNGYCNECPDTPEASSMCSENIILTICDQDLDGNVTETEEEQGNQADKDNDGIGDA